MSICLEIPQKSNPLLILVAQKLVHIYYSLVGSEKFEKIGEYLE